MFEVIKPRPAPVATRGIGVWLRKNLFSSPLNSVLTLVTGVIVVFAVYNMLVFILVDGSWAQVWRNMKLFGVYRYPTDLLWRPLTIVAVMMGLLGVMSGASGRKSIVSGAFFAFQGLVGLLSVVAIFFWPSVRFLWPMVLVLGFVGYVIGSRAPRLVKVLPWAWVVWLFGGLALLYGVTPGTGLLRIVPSRDWGGFLLTLVLFTGLIPSFPLGIALALGRTSKMPAIKYFCIGFIEVVRGAPLIMWLFIASLLLPLILNVDANSLPAILRAYVAITLFSAAYMAENVRGGLQAVPRGQGEAARALGLSAWQTTQLIVLPQALRAVIPAIVGQSIGLFKDTSLVFIVGLIDFFKVADLVSVQPESLLVTGGVKLEVFLFIASIYFFFAYRMSMASRQLERELGVGER
ncbi:MAG TPA: amino acid ABC transporter permease [Trueperaceae bacterium]|nr:amino acid ABC transporter permease [Trueperaceae bacterium]